MTHPYLFEEFAQYLNDHLFDEPPPELLKSAEQIKQEDRARHRQETRDFLRRFTGR